jgi:nicotinamide mononucleotide transporter
MIEQFIGMLAATSALEWAAMVMTTICIFLAGRNNIHTWWTGIVACTLYGVLFFGAQLYADVTLQIFFVITGIIGWYSWANINGGYKFNAWFKPGLQISRVKVSSFAMMVIGAVVVALGYGWLLLTFTDAFAPMIDSLVLTFSVVAQLLLMRRKIETWPLWIVVNTLAVPLFFSRELFLTALLYAIYWAHAWYAWWKWNRMSKENF